MSRLVDMISHRASQNIGSLILVVLLATSFIGLAVYPTAYGETLTRTDRKITVMTWNLYEGADLSPLFTATTPLQFVIAVGDAYQGVQETNFPERAESIANEIYQANPDLIGLQEAVLIRTQVPSDGPATPATDVSYDFIQILVDKLADRGLTYTPAIVQTGADIEVPGLFPTGFVDVRLTDRDAILVRGDLKDFTIANPQGAQFAAKLQLTTAVGPVIIPRSWVSVDVTFKDKSSIRVVSTHLDPISPAIQALQGNELLTGPADTANPVLFIGDFNSKADGTGTATYSNIIAAGFKDAWNIGGKGDGFTCCQDDELLNPTSTLSNRIDLALYRGRFTVLDAYNTGNAQEDRTTSGLWPSDHAGLVAELKVANLKK